MRMLLLALCALLFWSACRAEPDAQELIDRALDAHGSATLDRAAVAFDFRGKHFTVTRDGGRFSYERTYADTLESGAVVAVREVLRNDGLVREVDGRRVDLTDAERRSLETALNSVVYFALLPYKLNDPAVQKRYLGTDTLAGAPYHEVEVTFRQEGGGRDHQDRFVYWIHAERYTMDYLAYRFHTDGGGVRFRQAVNPRTVGGVRFADYLNFTTDSLAAIEGFDDLMTAGRLEPVSEVRTENVAVRPLSP